MTKSLRIAACICMTLCLARGVAAAERWVHVRVAEHGEDGEQVKINVPLALVRSLLPMVEVEEQLRGGKLHLGTERVGDLDLREILTALRDTPDARFVTIEGPDESVRVAKEKGYLVVHVDGKREEGGERVRVRMPLAVVQAMVQGDGSELDLAAALDALGEFEGEDLVRVESDDETVRIWIDSVAETP